MTATIDKIHYELFPHGADIGIRGLGDSPTKAFEMAALALTAVVTDPKKVSPSISLKIHLEEPDLELLFLDWINSLIYEMDMKRMLFSSFNISLKEGHLDAEIKGENVNNQKHDPAVDIKGATLTELKVAGKNDQWVAQCVVDV